MSALFPSAYNARPVHFLVFENKERSENPLRLGRGLDACDNERGPGIGEDVSFRSG